MAEAVDNPEILEEEDQFQEESMGERFMDWIRNEVVWYAGSFAVHLVGLSTLLLIAGPLRPPVEDAPSFQEAKADEPDEKKAFENYKIDEPEDNTSAGTRCES